jgi:hypothetical protein
MLFDLHSRRWIAAAVAALTGCVDHFAEPPRVDGVEPPTAFEGNATVISVTGSFPPGVWVSYQNRRRSALDTAYSLWLGELELEDVRYSGETELTAVAPGDMAAGSYDVVVVGPTGGPATLTGGFSVLPTFLNPVRPKPEAPRDEAPGATENL